MRTFERAEFSSDGKAEALHKALLAGAPRLQCFVAEADDSLVGYASCTQDFSTWKAAEYLNMDCVFVP
jgi:hypothetical protein